MRKYLYVFILFITSCSKNIFEYPGKIEVYKANKIGFKIPKFYNQLDNIIKDFALHDSVSKNIIISYSYSNNGNRIYSVSLDNYISKNKLIGCNYYKEYLYCLCNDKIIKNDVVMFDEKILIKDIILKRDYSPRFYDPFLSYLEINENNEIERTDWGFWNYLKHKK